MSRSATRSTTAPRTTAARFAINGASYQLLYTAGDLEGNLGGSGAYALATSINLASAGNWPQIASNGATFEGLGNTLSNLSSKSGNTAPGFVVEDISVVRDLIMTGVNVTSDGGLAAMVVTYNTGLIANVDVSGSVWGEEGAGGLVQDNAHGSGNGYIINSIVQGTVTGPQCRRNRRGQ